MRQANTFYDIAMIWFAIGAAPEPIFNVAALEAVARQTDLFATLEAGRCDRLPQATFSVSA